MPLSSSMKKNNIRVALINATKAIGYPPDPPLGIMYLASYLLKKKAVSKENIAVLDTNLGNPLDFLKNFQPHIIGISSLTPSYPSAILLAKKLRKALKKSIIITGGIHVSVFPNRLDSLFDIGVVSEGEETFYEIVKFFSGRTAFKSLKGVKGIIFRENSGKLVITKPRPLIEPLDKIPPIDWSLIPPVYFSYYPIKTNKGYQVIRSAPIFTSRGCPYNCIFCARKAIFKTVRFFSPKRIGQEISALYNQYNIKGFIIRDDTFTISKRRVKALIESLEKEQLLGRIVFHGVFGRADKIDDEFIRLLKKLGVTELSFGFETGSEKIIKLLKNNTVTVKQNKKAAELLEKYDLGLRASFMFGSPRETNNDLQKTLSFIRWLSKKENVISITPYITTPYPGTKLWQSALEAKTVSENMNWKHLASNQSPEKLFKAFFKNAKLTDVKRAFLKTKQINRKIQLKRQLIPALKKASKEQHHKNKLLIKSTRLSVFLHDFKRHSLSIKMKIVISQFGKILSSPKKIEEKIGVAKNYLQYLLQG